MNKNTEPQPDLVIDGEQGFAADVVYNSRHSGWGHHMEFRKWLCRRAEQDSVAAMFSGHLTPTPKAGQFFLMESKEGQIALFEIMKVKAEREPPDMFWCDAVLHGAVEEIDNGDPV